MGEVCAPSGTYDIDLALYGNHTVSEGDFVYAFDDEDHQVIARVGHIDADIQENGNSGHSKGEVVYFAKAEVLGYLEKDTLMIKRFPLDPETRVYKFSPQEIAKFLRMDEGLFLGFFAETETEVRIDIEDLLAGHTTILGRTRSGKSWTMGVLLEELVKRHVPILVIDPHGEYITLNQPYPKKGWETIKEQGLKPRRFDTRVFQVNPDVKDLKPLDIYIRVVLSEGEQDFVGVKCINLVSCAKAGTDWKNEFFFPSSELWKYAKIIADQNPDRKVVIASEESIYSHGQYMKTDIRLVKDAKGKVTGVCKIMFQEVDVDVTRLINKDVVNIINLRNLDPESSRVLVADIVEKVFIERKKGNVPPFVCVIEEAHIFAPSVSNEVSKPVLDTLSKEGRKFGMPTWFVSQRPQLLSTTIRANCENWIVLRITHPSDQSAIIDACEGLDSNAVKTLKNLPIGTALITGTMVDFPLLVKIRHRQSAHSYDTGFTEKLGAWNKVSEEE